MTRTLNLVVIILLDLLSVIPEVVSSHQHYSGLFCVVVVAGWSMSLILSNT